MGEGKSINIFCKSRMHIVKEMDWQTTVHGLKLVSSLCCVWSKLKRLSSFLRVKKKKRMKIAVKNPQQNTSKSNQTIYEKNYTP